MSRAKKALNPGSGSATQESRILDPGYWWFILMNLLGDHILVAKTPGHHGDEKSEEGPESQIRNLDPESATLAIHPDELTWRPHTHSQSSRPSRWWEGRRRHRIPGLDPQHWHPGSRIRDSGDTCWWTYLATTYSLPKLQAITVMRRAKKALNPGSGSATLEFRIRDPEHQLCILINLLGDDILVAKAPGHHGDKKGEEGLQLPQPVFVYKKKHQNISRSK